MAKSFKDAARARAAAQAQLDDRNAQKRAAALTRPDGNDERYRQKARGAVRGAGNAFGSRRRQADV